ncbi:hypothetical protein ACOME3_000380 [Neoechinorhynchus agilis]
MSTTLSRRKLYSAHLPDIIIGGGMPKQIPFKVDHLGAVMFSDVSGFTAMSQRYASSPHFNVDDMASDFNDYLREITTVVLQHGGDIYKFAGDAILVLWNASKRSSRHNFQFCVRRALDCALTLQKRFCNRPTMVGTELSIKSGISYGQYTCYVLRCKNPVYTGKMEDDRVARWLRGGYIDSNYYVCYGDAINHSNDCEHMCECQDIVIDIRVWRAAELDNSYYGEVIMDDAQRKFILVKGYTETISNESRFWPFENVIERAVLKNLKYGETDFDYHYDFIIKPVRKQLTGNNTWELMSELRHLTIVFIQIETRELDTDGLMQLLQSVVSTIYTLIVDFGGLLTKVLMFDKGLSFLCAFGLPASSKPNQEERGLKFAAYAHEKLSSKEFEVILSRSVGVTSGVCFCGIVGNHERCEYTVIGREVNLAARLMVAYPNIVSCDRTTFYKSRMIESQFEILPEKFLKGLDDIGTIRQFKKTMTTQKSIDFSARKISSAFPIVGREDDLANLYKIITRQLTCKQANKRDFVALVGASGIGITRFLLHAKENIEDSLRKLNVNTMIIQPMLERRYEFGWVIRSMVNNIFDLNGMDSASRMSFIRKVIDHKYEHNLFLLNDVFQTNFRKPMMAENFNAEILLHLLKKMFMDGPKFRKVSMLISSHLYVGENPEILISTCKKTALYNF